MPAGRHELHAIGTNEIRAVVPIQRDQRPIRGPRLPKPLERLHHLTIQHRGHSWFFPNLYRTLCMGTCRGARRSESSVSESVINVSELTRHFGAKTALASV